MQTFSRILSCCACLVLAACSAPGAGPDLDRLSADIMKASFHDEGMALVSRLQQDQANRLCSAADVAGQPLDAASAAALEAASLKTVKPPGDGNYLGDWKEGEKIAQSGRGLTWTDVAGEANGGNCYNCHQISKEELSFGTIGPSLYQYGKLRGVTDLVSPQAMPVVQYTWAKIWNSRAFNACSNMPRFGHNAILSERQIKDVMALLLDPRSQINQ